MQLRNNYDKGVFNGDLGRIAAIVRDDGAVKVDFQDKVVEYDSDELEEITLAYATSVHKSQGSEYPAVVIPLHTSHYLLLHRSILYTAVTRGKNLVVLVGSKKALAMAKASDERRAKGEKLGALDGISLTVNEVDGARFGVNIIPITQTATNLGQAREGDRVNLEIDLIARYVARLLAPAQ